MPISLVYHKGLVKLDGSAPMLLSGYGSYEVGEGGPPGAAPPQFCIARTATHTPTHTHTVPPCPHRPSPLSLWPLSPQISYEPSFNRDRLVLLDRGFVFAIAHIRGGGDMGRGW